MEQQGNTLILTKKEDTDFSFNLLKFLALNNNSSIILGSVFILAGFSLSVSYKKGVLLQLLNTNHNVFFDYFFKYITYLGDAAIYLPLALLLFVIDRKKVIALIYLLITQTFFSIIFKKVIFKNLYRPKSFFNETIFSKLHTVDGVTIHCCNSFPSGHTLTAFSLVFFFIFSYKFSVKIKWILLFLAALIGISRVYLLQHFFMDITFGAFLGILTAFLVTVLFPKIKILKLR